MLKVKAVFLTLPESMHLLVLLTDTVCILQTWKAGQMPKHRTVVPHMLAEFIAYSNSRHAPAPFDRSAVGLYS